MLRFFKKGKVFMKFVRFLVFLWLLIPCGVTVAVAGEFQNASKLLVAARRGDIQTVQVLINSGVDVNYVDSTGLSLVCTAVMNNDRRAIQVLQMYGADASNCDKQIKQYQQKTRRAAKGDEYSFFSGLSSTHVVVLSAVGVAAIVGGVVLLTNVFDGGSDHDSSGSNGNRPNNNNNNNPTTETTQLFAQGLPGGPGCNGTDCSYDFWESQQDFGYMSDNSTSDTFNYLMMARAYNAFVRGYLGMGTIRLTSDLSPFNLSSLPYASAIGGGTPMNVAMVTQTGVNTTGSAVDGQITWVDSTKIPNVQSICAQNGADSAECQSALAIATKVSHKYYNNNAGSEDTAFDLSDAGTVFGSATAEDTKLAKIIAGWEEGGRANGDFYGFIPNGQLTVYKTGAPQESTDYKNYAAIYDAMMLQDSGNYVTQVVANLSLPSAATDLGYTTVDDAKILNDAASTDSLKKSVFLGLVDRYYNLNTSDDTSVYTLPSNIGISGVQSENAKKSFEYLGNYQKQILVNPAGWTLYGDVGAGTSLSPKVATFENFAPAVYNDLQNLFMTVVAVRPGATTGTKDETISGYSAENVGKLELSTWEDVNDTSVHYQSRICGLAGTGNGGAMNPWCFAAPGVTDLEATAAMAGSVALVKGAFDYMTPKQVFLLLALTADGPYLGTNPTTNLKWNSSSELVDYLKGIYKLPTETSDLMYLEKFKEVFGYGMINLERATRPGTNIYFYNSDKDTIVSGSNNAYWGTTTASGGSRASSVLSLIGRSAIKTSFYDVLESEDGTLTLPRVWNMTFAENSDLKHGLYMGDVLADFSVDTTNKKSNRIGNFTFDMSLSSRAYNDNLNGLDNLRVAFTNEKYDVSAEYQHYLTDGESRFSGRANGVLSLVSNSVGSCAKYKMGKFAFGGRAFSGVITDEGLLENDPAILSLFEPGRLGLANGAVMDAEYKTDKFAVNVAFGNLHETNTVLGMLSDGILTMRGGDTQYVDVNVGYNPYENIRLLARGTFANTRVDKVGGIIDNVSSLQSNAFAVGADIGGFDFTVAMPLAVVAGKMGYDYAEFDVVENDGGYKIAINNPHVEYVDLAKQKRELRFSSSYRHAIGDWTDAGVGFIYRVNPNNTDMFGNESIFMFKMHHRLGI